MMTIDTLVKRNAEFAAQRFTPSSVLMPTLRTMFIGCVDPRIDPTHLLGLELGEAVIIRNIGGRVTPATLQTIGMLGAIAGSGGANPSGEFNLVVLQHTDCGITRLENKPDMLAGYFGIDQMALPTKAITDPWAAVTADVATLKATPFLPATWLVSGLVYDVKTGLVETVVAPSPLRNTETKI
jgi:carbonic anhydrase